MQWIKDYFTSRQPQYKLPHTDFHDQISKKVENDTCFLYYSITDEGIDLSFYFDPDRVDDFAELLLTVNSGMQYQAAMEEITSSLIDEGDADLAEHLALLVIEKGRAVAEAHKNTPVISPLTVFREQSQ